MTLYELTKSIELLTRKETKILGIESEYSRTCFHDECSIYGRLCIFRLLKDIPSHDEERQAP